MSRKTSWRDGCGSRGATTGSRSSHDEDVARQSPARRRSRCWPTPWSTTTTWSTCSSRWSMRAMTCWGSRPPASCSPTTEGELQVVASTSEASRLVELMQLGAQAGPCIECYRARSAFVSVASIASVPEEWGAFRDSATAHGFGATDAVPLRLRDTTIGALNLLRAEEGPPDEFDVTAARAFADVATIGILHERTAARVGAARTAAAAGAAVADHHRAGEGRRRRSRTAFRSTTPSRSSARTPAAISCR